MIASMNIAWWVQRWGELHPRKCAIIYEEERITYSELDRRANRTAGWLQSLGIEKGNRVAVLLPNGPAFIELYLACSRLGAIFVPLNFRLAPPELDYTLQNARPRVLVFGQEFAGVVAGLRLTHQRPGMLLASVGSGLRPDGILDYEAETRTFDGEKPFLTKSLGPASEEEPQVIMYTSGTTGLPKGAVLSHRKTFFNCLNAEIFFKFHLDDIMLIVLPLFHSGGLFIQASPTLYKGATMIIHPKFDPHQTFEDIQRYRVTKFLGVPTLYKSLVRAGKEKRPDLSSLQVCAIGGEKAAPEMMARFREAGFPLRQIMGQTETSILLWASEEDVIRRPGSVGRPVFHAEVELVDRDGRTVKPGEVGEIVVRGSIMMNGYWRDPARTAEAIRNGWLHTGDLARRDEEGYYYLVDRAKDLYISGGENVYPAEVERVLRQHPEVEDAAVVGIADEVWGEAGHAFVIRKANCRLSSEALIAFCEGKLARFKWPKEVTFCREFPQTALGKVRKSSLLEDPSIGRCRRIPF
jgi:fatty-acyl-CoA synthase